MINGQNGRVTVMKKIRLEPRGAKPQNALVANFQVPPEVLIWNGRVLIYKGTKDAGGETLHTWKQAKSVARIDPRNTDYFNVTT